MHVRWPYGIGVFISSFTTYLTYLTHLHVPRCSIVLYNILIYWHPMLTILTAPDAKLVTTKPRYHSLYSCSVAPISIATSWDSSCTYPSSARSGCQ